MAAEINATYRVVTPLFCAGADPNVPELRLASFKGVLRYWWRALAWSRCNADLDAIQRQEDKLFGSAGRGQSHVSMRLGASSAPAVVRKDAVLKVPKTKQRVGEGARYLGYGVMEAFGSSQKNTTAGQLTRACLAAPFEFTVQMRARGLEKQELADFKDALVALGIFGGIGAKSRKGYGSLVLRSLRMGEEKWTAPQTVADLKKEIERLRQKGNATGLPEFTALSRDTRIVLLSSDKKEPIKLLDLVGREMVRFRSWGHKGKVLGSESEHNFEVDHDLMMKPGKKTKHPERIAFGLPHNYGKETEKQVGPADKSLDRRASPLFIHIHECGETPIAVLTFLPARFLPMGNSSISVGGDKVRQAPEDKLYRPIHDFLDRLLDSKKRIEPFRNATEVRS